MSLKNNYKKSIILAVSFFVLLFVNIISLKAQNEINLISDTGKVGIGTINPIEKLDVKGNSVLDGKVSVLDSLKVRSGLSVESSINVKDSLIIGRNLRVNTSILASDVISNRLITNSIIGKDSLLFLKPDSFFVNCSSIVFDMCNRRIYGHWKRGTNNSYPGISIGSNSIANNEHSFAVGNNVIASGKSSIAIGSGVRAIADKSIIIGTAKGNALFSNYKPNSLMISFNQEGNYPPSVFVAPSIDGALSGNVRIASKRHLTN